MSGVEGFDVEALRAAFGVTEEPLPAEIMRALHTVNEVASQLRAKGEFSQANKLTLARAFLARRIKAALDAARVGGA